MKGLSACISVAAFAFLTIESEAQNSTPTIVSGNQYIMTEADKALGISGDVKVAVDLSADGHVKRAVVYVGPGWPCSTNIDSKVNTLMRSIEKWASDLVFKPEMKDGKAVETRLGLTVKLTETIFDNAVITAGVTKPISGGVVNGKATILPKPAYPSAARAERAEGEVNVQVIIDETGKVIWSQAISGHPLLMFSSRDAACSSKFTTTKLAGQPVKVSGVITYRYVP